MNIQGSSRSLLYHGSCHFTTDSHGDKQKERETTFKRSFAHCVKMSSLRLKIQLGDAQQSLKFVYVLDSPSSRTVAELIRSLEEHIRRQFCRPHLRLVRLTTHDGYLLSSTDRCHSVLKDNDCLLCIDMGKFSREVNPSLDEDNLWLDMKQHDASDDEEKYLQVGLTHTGLLFLRIKGSRAIYAIYLFSIHELLDIAKDKQRGRNQSCID